MDEAATPKTSRWIVATTCGALLVLLVIGGMFAMRDQLLMQARADAREQTREREKLGQRIDALQSALEALKTQPKTDETALAPINAALAEANTSIAALNERVDILEKKLDEKKAEEAAAPAPAPVAVAAPAPQPEREALQRAAASGQPFAEELAAWAKLHPEAATTAAALHDIAIIGIASDATLRQQLRETIALTPEAAKVDDTSLMGKINTHLKGLVRIKKSTDADPYASLRADMAHADITSLMRSVEQLSPTDRAPLADWLARAQAAQAAHDELAKLTPHTGT